MIRQFITSLGKGEIRNWIMTLTTTLVFGMFFVIAFHKVPETNKEMFSNMSNMIVTAWISAMSYYFGSSKAETDNKAKGGNGSMSVENAGDINVTSADTK